MIVNRRTFVPKRGHLGEAVALLKEAGETNKHVVTARMYVPEIAPFDVIAVEVEFESWDQYHTYWAQWSPGDGFWEKWYAITENGGSNEVWQLIE
jgi:hypothetical protein